MTHQKLRFCTQSQPLALRSVSIGDGIVIVGAHGDDDAGESSGSAYLFIQGEACADLNGDGAVGVFELTQVILVWGPCDAFCPEDINGDGVVDVKDLILVILNWGPCGGLTAAMVPVQAAATAGTLVAIPPHRQAANGQGTAIRGR